MLTRDVKRPLGDLVRTQNTHKHTQPRSAEARFDAAHGGGRGPLGGLVHGCGGFGFHSGMSEAFSIGNLSQISLAEILAEQVGRSVSCVCVCVNGHWGAFKGRCLTLVFIGNLSQISLAEILAEQVGLHADRLT